MGCIGSTASDLNYVTESLKVRREAASLIAPTTLAYWGWSMSGGVSMYPPRPVMIFDLVQVLLLVVTASPLTLRDNLRSALRAPEAP
jgi:hypothetical protein